MSLGDEVNALPRRANGDDETCVVLYPRNVRVFALYFSLLLRDIVPSSFSLFLTHASHFSIGEYWALIALEVVEVLGSAREFVTVEFNSALLITKFADGLLSCSGFKSSP